MGPPGGRARTRVTGAVTPSEPAVLHLSDARRWRGGEKQTLLLHRRLIERGHRSLLVVPRGSALAVRAGALGMAATEITFRGELDPRAAWRLAVLLRGERPSLIHAHTAGAHGLARVVGAVRPVPLVVSRRVVRLPSGAPWNRWKYSRGVAAYIAVSRAVAETLRRAGVGPARIRVVPSGVELGEEPARDEGRTRRKLALPEGVPIVGCLSALTREKGHDSLLAAGARFLRDCEKAILLIVGDGPERAALERQARSLPVASRIVFAGFREEEEDILGIVSLLVLPSLSEGLGTVLLEAMARGLAVVATRTGGIPEAVRDGENGLLVAPGDERALAGAVTRLLRDEGERLRMGNRGRELVRAFDVEKMVDGTERVYEEVLGRKSDDD